MSYTISSYDRSNSSVTTFLNALAIYGASERLPISRIYNLSIQSSFEYKVSIPYFNKLCINSKSSAIIKLLLT